MNRIGFLLFAVGALQVGLPTIAQCGGFSFEGPLSIAPAEAPSLLKQCSRNAPVPEEGGLLFPSNEEINVLETRLLEHLSSLQLDSRETPASRAQYRGQYVGFVRGSVKFIYASYSPSDLSKVFLVRKGRAVIVCDGGNVFWGIVYNPATGTFSELEVNGPA